MQRKKNQISFVFGQKGAMEQKKNEQVDDEQVNGEEQQKEKEEFYSLSSENIPSSARERRPRNKSRNRENWLEVIEGSKGKKAPIRKQKEGWKTYLKSSSKALLITCLAVGIGVMFGMVVLSIFSSMDENAKQTDHPESTWNQNEYADHISNVDPSAQAQNSNTPTIEATVQLGSRSYHVIQAGAFSEYSAIEKLANQYSQKGWPSLILDKSPYRLYLGVSSTKEDALLLGKYYEDRGATIYVKEHNSTPVENGIIHTKSSEALQLFPKWLNLGDKLMNELTRASTNGLIQSNYKLNNEKWGNIQELHRQFLEAGNKVVQGLGEEEKVICQEMMSQMSMAVNAIQKNINGKQEAYYWQVQKSTLAYIKSFEKLITK